MAELNKSLWQHDNQDNIYFNQTIINFQQKNDFSIPSHETDLSPYAPLTIVSETHKTGVDLGNGTIPV